jgi:mannose-6-phosphate isomerase-like protein (cupin superfamily)
MARTIDSPTTASGQAYVVGERLLIRELLVAATAWSFHTVCLKHGADMLSLSNRVGFPCSSLFPQRHEYNAVHQGRAAMQYRSISFKQKFGLFNEHLAPESHSEMNDYQFKVVKLREDFIWHDHKDTDETFIVIEGSLRIDFRDGAVEVSAGEMFVVPKGVQHKPYAREEVKLLLIEPRGVANTGHEAGERTAQNDVWI